MDGPGISAASELLVAASETNQGGLSVRAFNTQNGAMVWERVDTTYAYGSAKDLYDVSPIVVGPHGSAVVYVPSIYGYTYALNMTDGSFVWPLSLTLGWDGSTNEFKNLGVTAPLVIAPSGAVITANEIPKNQIRIWGNASFPRLVYTSNSLVSCGAIAGPIAIPPPFPIVEVALDVLGLSLGVGIGGVAFILLVVAAAFCWFSKRVDDVVKKSSSARSLTLLPRTLPRRISSTVPTTSSKQVPATGEPVFRPRSLQTRPASAVRPLRGVSRPGVPVPPHHGVDQAIFS